MKTFTVTYIFRNGDTFSLKFRGKERSAVYTKAAAHARNYYDEQPWQINVSEAS